MDFIYCARYIINTISIGKQLFCSKMGWWGINHKNASWLGTVHHWCYFTWHTLNGILKNVRLNSESPGLPLMAGLECKYKADLPFDTGMLPFPSSELFCQISFLNTDQRKKWRKRLIFITFQKLNLYALILNQLYSSWVSEFNGLDLSIEALWSKDILYSCW